MNSVKLFLLTWQNFQYWHVNSLVASLFTTVFPPFQASLYVFLTKKTWALTSLLYVCGPAAALRVMSYLPLPYSALSTLLIVPTPIRDAVYDYVAKHRYGWFGKADECLVLKERELLERFIDRDEIIGGGRSDLWLPLLNHNQLYDLVWRWWTLRR